MHITVCHKNYERNKMDYIKEIDFENNVIRLSKDATIKIVASQGENSLLITFSIGDNSQEKKSSTSKTNFEDESIPTVEEIVDYLETKNDYRHDNAELQLHFLGRVLNSREERQLYYKMRNIVKKAKDQIAKENEGMWVDAGTRSIETGSVKVTELRIPQDEDEITRYTF
jgi:hypothetical protein